MRLRVLVLSGSFHFRGTDHQCQDRSSWTWGQRNQRHRNQNMRSNQAGLPSSGPMIWSKKSCRHLRVVSCQGSAVICLITTDRGDGRQGEERTRKNLLEWAGVGCVWCVRAFVHLCIQGDFSLCCKGRHSSVFLSPRPQVLRMPEMKSWLEYKSQVTPASCLIPPAISLGCGRGKPCSTWST